MLSGFSREYDYLRSRPPPEGGPYCQVRLGARICLRASAPTPFNAPLRRCAEVQLLRPRFAMCDSDGILTVSAIGIAVRLSLRSLLTPGRSTLPGKPRSFRGGGSHPPCRYLYLQLLFRALQRGSPPRIPRTRNAPLPAP